VIIVLGVVVILTAILFPVLSRTHHNSPENRSRTFCQSNLKQIALGFKQYIQDYNEKYPLAKNSNNGLRNGDNWIGEIMPYMKSEQIFLCPSDEEKRQGQSSYGYNAWMGEKSEGRISNLSIIILNYEVAADPNGWTRTGTAPQNVSASTRHLEGANYSFVDGHVKWLKPERAGAWPPSQGKPTFVPN
jgi:prepilin-type processing-associated H-X9-DG protein